MKISQKCKESYWVRYITNRIKNNKNFLGIVYGPTGSGKSYACLTLAEVLDSHFSSENIVFKGLDFINLIESGKLRKGSVIIFEEAGVEINNRDWQSKINKMMNYLMQTFRHRNYIVLFNAPYMDFIDSATLKMFHAYFETDSIDFEKKLTKLKPRIIQYNSKERKFYYKMLKYIETNDSGFKRLMPVKYMDVGLASSDLIEKYEEKKTQFTGGLIKDIKMSFLAEDLKKKKEQKLAQSYQELEAKRPELSADTTRTKVINLLNLGMNPKQISKELKMSLRNIYRHITCITKKIKE
jgi:ABC-type dipeptide/oligopeptide/nickel transport system ATPase component